MKTNYTIIVCLLILLTGCDKDFLTKLPKDRLVPETAFIDYNNFQTYAWNLYNQFDGYSTGQYPATLRSEWTTDNLNRTQAGWESEYAYQMKIVPASGGNSAVLVPSGWNFNYVRRVNVMLDHIEQSQLSETDKLHWQSVGYFFRALRYYDLLAAFGDVSWIEHMLTDTSTSILYAPRTPRDVVAANILDNLLYAEENIKPEGDGANTINVHVVRALISRFALFEGTWRKYHGLPDSEIYLEACKIASEKLLSDFPTIMDNYNDVFNSEDLTGQPGIILFKQYAPNLLTHSNPRFAGSTSWNVDLTKDAVSSYLCSDGKPTSSSDVFDGDRSMYDEFRNRDHRLYYTVLPPYKVRVGSPSSSWTNTDNPADAEYIDLMNTIGGIGKTLPMLAWSRNWDSGNVISMSPHFRSFNNGQPQSVSELGYFLWKFYNKTPLDNENNSSNDAPLFRIEEVMLNYAEAMWELGEFSQSVADITINKLRERAHVAPMGVATIGTDFDTDRDESVDPILWEIRRERRVELMADGFRFNDLKRWKKGHYLNKKPLGVWAKNAEYNNSLNIHGGGTEGYVEYFPEPSGWLDAYYLEPLPTQDLVLNENLKQNPGYLGSTE